MGDIEANVKVLDGTVNGDKVALNNNATFERAAEDSIENKGYAKWYPIAKLGVTYRF